MAVLRVQRPITELRRVAQRAEGAGKGARARRSRRADSACRLGEGGRERVSTDPCACEAGGEQRAARLRSGSPVSSDIRQHRDCLHPLPSQLRQLQE